MAKLTNRPDLSSMMPGVSTSGISLLKSITATTIWSETSLQYFFGSQGALTLDSEFDDIFHTYFTGQPDTSFFFKSLATRAFSMIDAISKVDFSPTTDKSKADHVLVSVDNNPGSTIEGFFQFPGWATRNGNPTDAWSLGAFNSALDTMRAKPELGGGEYANWTIIHEVGHSVGLQHTHQEVDGLPPLPTVGKYMNNEKYSVMSYNSATPGVANYGHAVSMMALDVAALQSLYGKEDYATGNSAYTLLDPKGGALSLTEGDVQVGRAYYCIWDSKGIDQIDYSGSGKPVLINLNDATLNTAGVDNMLKALFNQLKAVDVYTDLSTTVRNAILDPWQHAGGFFSQVLESKATGLTGISGGYTIAHGAIIENAIGGAGADFLLGNEQANRLVGNNGADTLLGSAGGDNLLGVGGSDWLDGGSGDDRLSGGAGADYFIFGKAAGTDRILDFTVGDAIDLTRQTEIISFSDLKLHHMSNGAEGVEIRVGTDLLIIKNHVVNDFTYRDFVI